MGQRKPATANVDVGTFLPVAAVPWHKTRCSADSPICRGRRQSVHDLSYLLKQGTPEPLLSLAMLGPLKHRSATFSIVRHERGRGLSYHVGHPADGSQRQRNLETLRMTVSRELRATRIEA